MQKIILKGNESDIPARKAQYSAKALAHLLGLTDRQLQREVHRQLAESPQHWLDRRRIQAARELLLSGQMIKQVAPELGFKQTSHFCRQFKNQNQMTPSQFLRSANQPPRCRL